MKSVSATLLIAAGTAMMVARCMREPSETDSVQLNIDGVPVVTVSDSLRVCADPNNLPFSNSRLEGFENKIAERVAADLGTPITYRWWAQRRGFVRNTLNAGLCDVIFGVPTNDDRVITTRAYYRSSYVFVTRRDRSLQITSLDDSVLRRLKIGVQLIGDDFANTPPAHALTARGMAANLVGYTVYGDYRTSNPVLRIMDAVTRGDVDVAVVWGPIAGYVALKSATPLALTLVQPRIDRPYLPFVFDMAAGLRMGDTTFRARLDDAISRQRPSIDSILRAYGVPRVDFKARQLNASTSMVP